MKILISYYKKGGVNHITKLILTLTTFLISEICTAQIPSVDVEGRISLYLSQDTTSIHIGKNAGINQDLSISRRNTFVGFNAGKSTLNGFGNSFFGDNAGSSNTFGESNNFFGWNAGRENTTGFNNNFFGQSSGISNTSGSNNSFFGGRSGNSNMQGNRNSFFGRESGNSNTSGSDNSFFGSQAGFSNEDGHYNTLIGAQAGSDVEGSHNVMIGYKSGCRVAGVGNVIIGNFAGPFSSLQSTSVNLNNRLFIHNDATISPLIYGEFDNDFLKINGSGDYADLLRVGTDSPDPAYPSSGEGLELVYDTDSNLGLIQSFDRNNNSWGNLYLGNGNTGIGTTNPSVALDVIGDIEYTGTITDVSDIRLKENIEPIEGALNKVLTLEGFTYNLIGDDNRSVGFSAQDILKVLPEAVKKIDDQYYGVDYTQMIPLLLEAIKEQQDLIELQQKELEQKEDQFKLLLDRIVRLESQLE